MLLFFYGEETFPSAQKVRQLKKEFMDRRAPCEPIVFDCGEVCDVHDIIGTLGVQDLFSSEKMIVIEDFFAHTKAEEQKQLLDALDEGTTDTLIFYEKGVPRKNAKLFTWLVKNADTVTESKKLQGYALEKWIQQTCRDRSIAMDMRAIKELLLYSGTDLWLLSQEIDKLGSYACGREVSVDDVRQLVHGRVDADMFETVEAIALGEKARALFLLKKQRAKGDDAFHIFSMYAYQLRTLLLVSGVMRDEHTSDKTAIAKILKIHPFVVQKSLLLLRNISHKELKKLHKELTRIDSDVKQGKRQIDDALDLFIARI